MVLVDDEGTFAIASYKGGKSSNRQYFIMTSSIV